MKKIGVITLNGNYNFGNRLQNYAMMEVLKRVDSKATVYGVGATQEEVGLKGAKVTSYKLNPDMAFARGMLPHHVGAIDMAEVQLK